MKLRNIFVYLTLALMLVLPNVAFAEDVKTFGVSTFAINGPAKYKYLSKGIQDMLNSRLYWQGHVHGVDKEKVNQAAGGAPVTEANAADVISKLGVDYIVFGSVTIMGEECSLDLRIKDKNGQDWPRTATSKLDSLIPKLETVAKQVNGQVFSRSMAEQSQDTQPERVNQMNPYLVHNEAKQNQEFYLNPQFRYAGGDDFAGRLRSQSLPFVANSMIVGDANGDGFNECFVADNHTVYAYTLNQDGKFEPLGQYEVGLLITILRLSLYDADNDGENEVIVCAVDSKNFPRSYVLDFDGKLLRPIAEQIKHFLTVVFPPPLYRPMLVGQHKGHRSLFSEGVYEVVKMGGEYTAGQSLLLPPEATVFNFTYMPLGDDYKIAMLDRRDKIRIYTKTGDRQWTSDKMYSGSSTGIVDDTSPVFMNDEILTKPTYYVPSRMVAYDLNKDENYELLVNHPVSVAAQFFTRYRYFPQGEIHSMAWDGVGMSLVWKTRRIKGSVVDCGIQDIDNNGIPDLYVCINTHPGVVGVKFRRTVVLAYPLDTSQDSGKVDDSFKEE